MSEWQVKPLAELADIKVSNVDKKSMPGELSVRLCNYMDVYAGRYLGNGDRYMDATCTTRELATFGLRRGDILITKDSESPDDIAIPALIDDDVQELVCGYHLAVLRLRSDALDPVVLLKQLESERLRRYFGQRAGGSTRYGLSTRAIAQAPILVPPEEAQRSIVETHRSLDTQITHTEALIAKQEQVRAGLMQDLFTRGVDETGRLRPPREEAPELYHETAFGWLPRAWELVRLGRCSRSLIDGPFGSNLKTEHYVDEPGTLVVRLQNIQKGTYDDTDRAWISNDHARRLSAFGVNPGDVLIASMGDETYEVGRACLYPDNLDPAINKADCFRLRPDLGATNPEFLMNSLNTQFVQRQKERFAQGVTRRRMNLGNCRRLLVPLAPKPEQDLITEALIGPSRLLRETRTVLGQLRSLRTALLRDLLTPPASAANVPRIAAE